jgi:hypothetical protein
MSKSESIDEIEGKLISVERSAECERMANWGCNVFCSSFFQIPCREKTKIHRDRGRLGDERLVSGKISCIFFSRNTPNTVCTSGLIHYLELEFWQKGEHMTMMVSDPSPAAVVNAQENYVAESTQTVRKIGEIARTSNCWGE